MKWFPPLIILVIGGCAPQQGTPKATFPQVTLVPSPSPTAKPTPKPTKPPLPEEVRALSRDGRIEAIGKLWRTPLLHGGIEVREAKTKRILATWEVADGVTGVSFSPDETLLAVNAPERLEVWKWKPKRRVYARTFDTGGQFRIQSAFSPNGKQLAVTFGELIVFDVASWKFRSFPQLGDPAFVENVVWAPNGRLLAIRQQEVVSFSLVNPKTGKILGLGGLDGYSEPLFSPDSCWLAGANESGLFLWRVKNGLGKRLGGDYKQSLDPVAFSSDSRLIACQDEKRRLGVWQTRDGKQISVLHKTTSSPQALFERAKK